MINHKGISEDYSDTAIYDCYDYLEQKREVLENWSERMIHLLNFNIIIDSEREKSQ